MKQIKVRILDHNFNINFPKFLAKLTQRGHEINSIFDIENLYDECTYGEKPSEYFMTCPHSTLRRMNYLTVAIEGLSTKCVSQLRTHAKRLTFISTSTQYSNYSNKTKEDFVIPDSLSENDKAYMKSLYDEIRSLYRCAILHGIDKDVASYILPQGLRKALIISGNLDDWQYVMKTRLCRRNSEETQLVMKLIRQEIKNECGERWIKGMEPNCICDKCKENKMSCGKPMTLEELEVN